MTRTGSDRFVFLSVTILTAAIVFIVFGFLLWVAYPILASEGLGFLTGTTWNYSTHEYGIFYFLIGTLALTAVTMLIAAPMGVMSAIFLAEIAPRRMEQALLPFVELLVGIPSIVYGLFGLFVLEMLFRNTIDPFIGNTLGNFLFFFADANPRAGTSILLASVILAVMIFPTIVAISYDSLKAIPRDYREASYALGTTKWETISKVVIPAAMSGIFTAIILGVMRAMGETMAVVMLMGNFQVIPTSILDSGYAMTSKILNDIVYHMDEEEPRAALFAIAVVLFAMEFLLVGVARYINKRITRHLNGGVA